MIGVSDGMDVSERQFVVQNKREKLMFVSHQPWMITQQTDVGEGL